MAVLPLRKGVFFSLADVNDETEVAIRSPAMKTNATTPTIAHVFFVVIVVLQNTCCSWVLFLVFHALAGALA